MIWTPEYLAQLELEAELQIAEELKCIYDRVSLNITSGEAVYQLPEYVSDIIKITWLGIRLDPIPQIEYPDWAWNLETSIEGAFEAEAFTDAYNIGQTVASTPQGKPERYFFSTFGENKILFHPTPNENLVALTGDLWNTNLDKGVIIEFYRTPLSPNFELPKYIRRRTIKAYVLWKAFTREGDGQNLKAAKYWANKYIIQLARAKQIIDRINSVQIRSRSDATQYTSGRIARPKLPWNWQTVKVSDWD